MLHQLTHGVIAHRCYAKCHVGNKSCIDFLSIYFFTCLYHYEKFINKCVNLATILFEEIPNFRLTNYVFHQRSLMNGLLQTIESLN